jgi:hypothetical protein
MTISVQEGSEYFRGLLILISKDRRVTDEEMVLMRRIGKSLGLEKKFCETAIQDILENTYVNTDPPRFPMPELARKFIKDGLTLAGADSEAHGFETGWLKAAAETNGLDEEWFLQEKKLALHRSKDDEPRLEVDDLKVEYSKQRP